MKKIPNNNSNHAKTQHKISHSSHQAKKRFGQNFLSDPTVIDQIISAIQPIANDRLIEIGPGLGALTTPLLSKLDHLQLIEIDRDLIAKIRTHYSDCLDRITLIEADALKVDFTHLTGKQGPFRIVGNLPYNISTPILFHLIEHKEVISDMHFMLQKEVVDRMVAQPGNKQYGRLSVMLQYHCQIESLFDVPPTAFNPKPKVMSSIVRLKPLPNPINEAKDPTLFKQLVANAFNQRRKVIRNSLDNIATAEQLESAGIDSNLRPEQMSLKTFVTLSNFISEQQS